jgi:SAM-dependent methyltransferase
MVGRASNLQPRFDSAVVAVTGVISTFLAAFVFEALTDRDWALQGWEWLEVIAFALLLSLAAVRVISFVLSQAETWLTTPRLRNGARVSEGRDALTHDTVDRAAIRDDIEGGRGASVAGVLGGALRGRELVRLVVPLRIRRPLGISLFRARTEFNLARRQALARVPSLAARDLVYDDWYYDKIDRQATELYNRLADTLVELRSPASVVDVGCGTGMILNRFADAGVLVRGIEGSSSAIARSPVRDRIVRANLERGVPRLGRFDVCFCIEVAEHLGRRSASRLVAGLTGLSDLVVFTASQGGGMGHLTIRPMSYWRELFALHGFSESPLTTTLLAAIADIPEPWYIHKDLVVFEKRPKPLETD